MNVHGTLLYKVCMSIACTWLRAYQWCIENVWYAHSVRFIEVLFNIDWVSLVQYVFVCLKISYDDNVYVK